ncbi:MAG: stress-like protein (gls24) [Frondihabitans sp.]|nr:stress-like protein (gls24) [Frondihabitans sp.]
MANITPTTTSHSDDGKTVIQENVVAKIAGIAAREVSGVYDLGGGVARAFGVLRDATNNTDLTQGVTVEVGDNAVQANLTIVVLYPTKIHKVAAEVRRAVITALTELADMDVVEVNITVTDVHVPSDDHEEPTATGAVTAKVEDAKATASQKLDAATSVTR